VVRHRYDHDVSASPTGHRAAVSSRRDALGFRGTTSRYPGDAAGYSANVVDFARRRGIRGWQLQGLSLATVGLCVSLWIRAKTVDQDERGNAERRALFVGLWPPMFWMMGDTLDRRLARARRSRLLPRRP
jgi:hypothetical protein